MIAVGHPRRLRGAGTAACLLALLGSASSLRAGQTVPVPIEKGICYQPEIHDNAFGHLLFSYVVTATGRVENVRLVYSDLQPGTDPSRLIGALTRCMEGWKFKPGTRDGQPRAIPMVTPFHFFRPAPPEDPQVRIPGGETIGQSRLEEMREEKLRLVEHLLAGRLYIEERGPGWVLKTDVGRKDANVIRDALVFATGAFDAAFPGLPSIPDSLGLTVVVFRDVAEYGQVAAFDNLIPVQALPTGTYFPEDRIIYMAKGPKPTPVVTDVIVHESVHHLVSYRLLGNRDDPPFWIQEGIASFFELLKKLKSEAPDLAALERGRVSGGGFEYLRNADHYLRMLREAERKGDLPKLQDLLRPQCPRSDLGVALSWLLVHYLVNAEGGGYRAAFKAWMSDPASEDNAESLPRALGRSLQQVEAALPAYARSLK